MNTYRCSNGERVTQGQIEYRMTKAKGELLQEQRDEHGYNFCTTCKRNDCKPVDCAHKISVQEAKNTGRAELCWDKANMEPTGRYCHQKKDKLNLQFENEK